MSWSATCFGVAILILNNSSSSIESLYELPLGLLILRIGLHFDFLIMANIELTRKSGSGGVRKGPATHPLFIHEQIWSVINHPTAAFSKPGLLGHSMAPSCSVLARVLAPCVRSVITKAALFLWEKDMSFHTDLINPLNASIFSGVWGFLGSGLNGKDFQNPSPGSDL